MQSHVDVSAARERRIETWTQDVFQHMNYPPAWQAAAADKGPFKCIEGGVVLKCVARRWGEATLSGGFPRGQWEAEPLSAHPVKPIVSLMNRQDLMKTFQTSFGPAMRRREAPPQRTLNTPMIWGGWPLPPPLKGEPTNHRNAFSRGLSRSRLPFPPPTLFSLLATLVVKNSLDAVCIASSRMSPLDGRLCRREWRLSAGAGGDWWSSDCVPRCSPRLLMYNIALLTRVLGVGTRRASCLMHGHRRRPPARVTAVQALASQGAPVECLNSHICCMTHALMLDLTELQQVLSMCADDG